jgi:ATP-binding cassette subfamily B protein
MGPDKKKLFLFLLLSNIIAAGSPLLLKQLPYYPALAFVLFVLLILSILLKYHVRIHLSRMSTSEEEKLKEKIFGVLQKKKEPFFQEHPPGEVLHIMTSDLTNYRDLLYFGSFSPINFLTLSIPSFFISLYLSWPLALLSLIPLLGILVIMWGSLRSIERQTTSLQESLEAWNIFLLDVVKGIRSLKHPIAQEKLSRFARKLSHRIEKTSFPLRLLESSFFPFVNIIGRSTTLIFVIGALYLVKLDYLPLLNFLSFLWIQGNLLAPILFLGWTLPIIYRGKASWKRIQSFLKTDDKEEIPPYKISTAISIKNLSFKYPKGEKLLFDGLNLELLPHQIGAIAGPVGAGKTTLFRLLLKEYPLLRGEISLPEKVAYAEQTPFLFTGTIKENILLGHKGASSAELETVLIEAGLSREISHFPEGLNTLIGERGMTLSGGQKKRIAFARALLSNRPLLLVDEPFNALDPSTIKQIQTTLKKRSEKQTVLVITSHVPFLLKADRIFYLTQGKIVQAGGQELFMDQDGPLHHLKRLYETLHQ